MFGIKRAAKQAKRVGAQTIKVLFQVQVKRVVFPTDIEDSQSLISVCFERGGKMASSEDHSLHKLTGNSFEVTFGETLSVVATLYRDSHDPPNTYQSKKGKLVIRQRKHSKYGGDSFKGMGVAYLKLEELASTNPQAQMFTYTLEKCSIPGSTIEVIITSKFLGEGDAGDETMSTMSGVSDTSAGAASFDADDDQNKDFRNLILGSIEEEDDKDISRTEEEPQTLQSLQSHDHNNSEEESNKTIKKVQFVDRPVSLNRSGSLTLPPHSPLSPPVNDYQQLLESYKHKCNQFESQINVQEATIQALKSQIVAKEASHAVQIQSLSRELMQCKDALSSSTKPVTHTPNSKVSSPSTNPSVSNAIASELQSLKAENAALTKEYSAAASMILALESDNKRYKELLAEATESAKSREEQYKQEHIDHSATITTLAALQSKVTSLPPPPSPAAVNTTTTTPANITSATTSSPPIPAPTTVTPTTTGNPYNEDIDALLQELIATKMSHAILATESDEERVKIFQMKRKLQWYAERVAALEVATALKKR